MLRRLLLTALLLLACGGASARDMGPGTVVGKVTNRSNPLYKRRIFLQAGRYRWAIHVNDTTRVYNGRRQISLHDINLGTYVVARGRRIGRLRLDAYRIDIAGDRLAFRKSRHFRPFAPNGYFVGR